MRTNTRLYSVRNCTVYVSVCRRFGVSMFWCVDVLVCQHFLGCFGLSTFWSVDVTFWFVDVLVFWRFGLSTFWSVDVLVSRRFSLSTFWSIDVSVCRRFGLSTFWMSTFRFVDVLTSYLQKGPLKHIKAWLQIWASFCRQHIQIDFFNGIFYNLACHEFYFLNIIYILLNIDLILSTFFQDSNILTRASHHWCLASNIVLVASWYLYIFKRCLCLARKYTGNYVLITLIDLSIRIDAFMELWACGMFS